MKQQAVERAVPVDSLVAGVVETVGIIGIVLLDGSDESFEKVKRSVAAIIARNDCTT